MNSMLDKISGYDLSYNSVDVYNQDFFSKHLDINKVISLIAAKSDYTFLCHLLDERYYSNTALLDDSLKKELAKTEVLIKMTFEALKYLDEKRIELINQVNKLYNEKDYDPDKARSLENDIDTLSRNKAEQHFDLNKLLNKKNSLLGQKKRNDSIIARMDRDIEHSYDRLKKDMADIDLSKLDIFGCFESKEIRSEYEKGLARYIPDPDKRKLYSDYFYKMVTKEAEFIETAIKEADDYLKKATKDKNFHLEELDERNHHMYNYDSMFGHMAYNVTSWIAGPEQGRDPRLVNAYRDIEGFIDNIFEYSENFEKYTSDPILEGKTYDKLRKQYIKIYEKNEKKKPTTLGFITKKGVVSIESVAYKDLAIDTFDFFINTMYRNRRARKATKELNPETKINNKFKPINKDIKVESTKALDNSLQVTEEEGMKL